MLVLVADDDRAVRESLERALQLAGYEVELAPDGDAALAAIERRTPDAVVLDVMMPGIDGIEVCEKIDHTKVKVIMLSARDDAETKERATAAGADAYLTKPFSAIELLDAVEKLVPA
jgi:two-component system response regulator MprA